MPQVEWITTDALFWAFTIWVTLFVVSVGVWTLFNAFRRTES